MITMNYSNNQSTTSNLMTTPSTLLVTSVRTVTQIAVTDNYSFHHKHVSSKPIFSNACSSHFDPDAELFQFITNGVLLNLVGILGILGNIISMIILSRPQMRSSINYLLIGLASCDTVLILTSMLLFGIPAIYPYTGYLFQYNFYVRPHLSLFLYPLSAVAQTVSVYITLTVTLERFVAVCHPLRARSWCTYGRARLYVIFIIIFSVLYNLPKFWEGVVYKKYDDRLDVYVYCVAASQLRRNPVYIRFYTHWSYLIFLYFLPFSSLAVLNAAIYRQVRKANRERQRLSRLQRREIGLATMLLCVVMVFFLCNILPLIVNVMEAFYNIIIDQLVKISNLLVTINSSVNFIIYVIFGEKFKKIFLRLFCSHGIFGITIGRESPDGATHDDSFISTAGDRQSIRLHRQSTMLVRNGMSIRINGSLKGNKERSRSVRLNAQSPCVYYPTMRDCKDINIASTPTSVTILTNDDNSSPPILD